MQNPLSFLDVKIELVKISIGIVQQELDGRSLFTVRLAMKLLFRTTPETSLTQFIAASCCRADVAGLTLRLQELHVFFFLQNL